ncbi:MAG: hypothetical protein HW421_21 [Ignavibacteria bacterium]|nr:hypothetical protein [Ignavibacteria bacterium]
MRVLFVNFIHKVAIEANLRLFLNLKFEFAPVVFIITYNNIIINKYNTFVVNNTTIV